MGMVDIYSTSTREVAPCSRAWRPLRCRNALLGPLSTLENNSRMTPLECFHLTKLIRLRHGATLYLYVPQVWFVRATLGQRAAAPYLLTFGTNLASLPAHRAIVQSSNRYHMS
jgi:hypothetical protein